ncbi:MAG TPA: cytochrome c [Pirellulales bacterium]|nr:cytochrome c [Pirellulales bacterium]
MQIANCKIQIAAAMIVTALAGCHGDMYDQPRYDPLEKSDFFADGRASRPVVTGAIARGDLRDDEPFYSGKQDGKLVEKPPIEINQALVERGRQRFNIFCTPCHGRAGYGDGMIVRRGFRQPPTYHSDRLRGVPIGHFFDVMTNGFATMPDYAEQIPVRDRWAIAVYVRALQLSQYAQLDALDDAERQRLEGTSAP